LPEEHRRPGWQIALDQIKNPLIYILFGAGLLAVSLGDVVDASVILAVVVLNGIIGFWQESKAEAAILALKKLAAFKALVVRGDSEQEIDAEDLVPGDVVLLQAGAKVPADVRLTQAKEMRVDQSMFTGESVPAEKDARPLRERELTIDQIANMALMGVNVSSGRGRGIVVETGPRTELGRISKEVTGTRPVKTPIELRMETLSHYILAIVLGFGALGFTVGILRGDDLILLLLTLVALAVAAVPEGLPVAMTIALANAVNLMAKQHAIIRHLPAIETLGSCTTIGSDKTGTLTKNEMTVQRIWAGDNEYPVTGLGYAPVGELQRDGGASRGADETLRWTLRTGLLCNESLLVEKEGRWSAVGDPTEVALISSAGKGGLDREIEREAHEELDLLPFESTRQYMATLNRIEGRSYLLVKGSPEAVLGMSRDMMLEGATVPLEPEKLMENANGLAARGLRVLAMAYRPADGAAEITHDDVRDLTFLGIQGMLDPPRPEAMEAVRDCRASGIRVMMITGDNELTGLSIARRIGIADEGETALTGREVDHMDDEALRVAVRQTRVFARVSPTHKFRIIKALIANKEIVAVTGDGVNDAPALKAAHIGVAMGISGTDVAKEVSDMVISDDNFASLYQAVVTGRVAFDNLRKVTFFLLSSGLGQLLAVMTNLFTTLPLIFLPAQILWVNLVTNGLQDVALAFDPAEPGIERRPPRPPTEGVLNRTLIIRLAIIGLTLAVVSLGVFTAGLAAGMAEERARTIALTTIVFGQFFNIFNSRSERLSAFKQNPLENRFLAFSLITAFIAQMALIYWEPLRFVFRTTALSAGDWLIIIPLSFLVLVAGELDKWRVRSQKPT
jgi:P-type Ca2+ transporter type 2C